MWVKDKEIIVIYGIPMLLSYLERSSVGGRLLLPGMVWDVGDGEGQPSRALDCSFVANRRFQVDEAYLASCGLVAAVEADKWQQVWTFCGPQRYGFTAWLARHDQLATHSLLFNGYYSTDPFFPVCNHDVESTLHVLRDCSWVCGA